jgi:hypothetical protein
LSATKGLKFVLAQHFLIQIDCTQIRKMLIKLDLEQKVFWLELNLFMNMLKAVFNMFVKVAKSFCLSLNENQGKKSKDYLSVLFFLFF